MRRFIPLLLAAAFSAFACAAAAGELSVLVTTPGGAPIADAVVTVQPAGEHARPQRFGQPLRISQRDLKFDPFVLVAPTGAEVVFPNQDPVRHQVYSFSAAKKFELRLYGKEETRTVRFDRPGVVAIGCNIHDSMSAFVFVTDAPYAAKTDASGRVRLRDLPPGPAVVKVWRPYLKAPGNELRQEVSLPAQGVVEQAVKADVRTPPMRGMSY